MEEKAPEEKIFEAAREEFHEHGYHGARMQAIADRAGINKAMLHYYYRNKDKLFEAVFRAAAKRAMPQVIEILRAELPLSEKVERVVHAYIDLIAANPHLPRFVIHELNRHPERLARFMGAQARTVFPGLAQQIREAVARGEIRPIEPEHFLANLVALCVFPFMAKPMLQAVTGLDEEAYAAFLQDRKRVVTSFILDALRP